MRYFRPQQKVTVNFGFIQITIASPSRIDESTGMSSGNLSEATNYEAVKPASERTDSPTSLVPLRPGDAPFRNLLTIPENKPNYLAEAKREIQLSALRRLEALERVYQELVEQAQTIVHDAQRDLLLHDVWINASKIRGQTYYLYERQDRSPAHFFSILAPLEYGQADPRATYLAAYRLNEDNSWTRLDGDAQEPWLKMKKNL